MQHTYEVEPTDHGGNRGAGEEGRLDVGLRPVCDVVQSAAVVLSDVLLKSHLGCIFYVRATPVRGDGDLWQQGAAVS